MPPFPASPLDTVRGPRWRGWAVVLGAWAAYSAVMVALWRAAAPPGEATLAWAVPVTVGIGLYWIAATPLVRWLTRRLAPERVGLARSLVWHGAAALALSVGCVAARWALYARLFPDMPRRPLLGMVGALLDYHVFMYVVIVAVSRAAATHDALVARARSALALEGRLARARLEYLQRQLQPHFLFNALNATAELTREAPALAARMLRQLARLLRFATDRADAAELPLRDELAVLEAYVDVQRVRFGPALEVEYRVEPAAMALLVPTLVLQPLAENAIRHGLARSGGRVAVTAERRGDRLRLCVADAGGMDAGGADAPAAGVGRGIGLANTRDRLRELYGDAHRLDVRHDPRGGFAVTLELPARERPAGAAGASGARPPLAAAAGALPDVSPGGPSDAAHDAGPNTVSSVASNASPNVLSNALPDMALGAAPDWLPHAAHGVSRGAGAGGRAGVDVVVVPLARGAAPPAPGAAPRRSEPGASGPAAPGAGGDDAGGDDAGAPVPFRYVVLAWTLCACLWCVQTAVVEASRPGRRVGRAPMGYVIQFACAAVWIAFTPGVLWAARRLRVAGPRWGRALAAHVALGAAMAVVQQWLTNALVGDVRLRLSSLDVLPLSLNGFVYLALVAWVQARAFAAASRERALAADRLAADLERVRLRSLALELRPAFVSAVLVGGAELAVRDPARAERVVEQLADLLRAVLDEAAAERPPTVREELALVAAALALLEQLAGRPVRLDDAVPPALRDAPVAAGALRRVLDLAAARAADPGAAAVDVRVAPAVGAPGAGEAGVPSLVAHVRTTPAAHAASA